MILSSATLEGAVHGFATRQGGVSRGAFASLNLGRQTGDAPELVAENHRRLAEAGGFDGNRLATPARQVHGATVVRAATPAHAECDCDAIVSGEPGLVLGVRTADCVPVLLWHPGSGRAGAVHAGWRGVAASIVPAAVAAMDVPAAELRAAIGPAIGACCYEVDDATSACVCAAAPDAAVISRSEAEPSDEGGARREAEGPTKGGSTRPGHVRIDLTAGVRGQLVSSGVPAQSVEAAGGCTSCDAERWFSHRRDRGTTGRHLSFIVAGRR